MAVPRVLRFGVLISSVLAGAGIASAAPPAHGTAHAPHPGGGGHPTGYRPTGYAVPYNYGSRVAIGIGIGSGYGLYGPPIGRPYNSFYAFGVPYNDGYGSLGYGYPSGFRGSNYGTFGVPLNPGTYYPDPQYRAVPQSPYPIEQVPAPQPAGDPNPVPLPLPPNGAGAGATEGTPATITVVASAGAKVTFDGIDTEQTGGRHSFTTRPIAPGAEKRVSIKVDGPGGPSTMVLSMRAGEKATVDMRK